MLEPHLTISAMSAFDVTPILEGEAASLLAAGKIDDALRVGSTCVETARRAVEEDARYMPALVQAMENLAEIKREAGQVEEAISLYGESLDAAVKAGLETGVLAQIRTSLATTMDSAGHEADSMAVYEQAIKDLESLEPPDEQTSSQLRNNLAMNYKRANKLALAEQHYLRALEITEALNPESEDAAAICNNLGSLYYAAGFASQAKDMFEEAMKIRVKLLGPEHRDVAQSHCNLASVQHELGEDEAAQRSYEQSLRILEANIQTEASSYEAVGQDYIALLGSLHEDRKASVFQRRMEKVLAQVRPVSDDAETA